MIQRVIPFLSLRNQHGISETRSVMNAMQRVIQRGQFILGSEVSSFEKQYAEFNGTKFCVGTGNGLDALTLSLKALGIAKGDEVIVPSNTCQPTWLAVSLTGARCVPVEPDEATMNVDPAGIEAAITSRTKAVVPVHLYGQACQMDRILAIAKRNGIAVVEDNAQAHGATFKGRMTGSFGVVNATSFYPTKNLGALGDGGAVTTDDRGLFESISSLRSYGKDQQGINSRLDELQAAVLKIKLAKLEQWNKIRQVIASRYLKSLNGIGEIRLPQTAKDATHVYHLFVVRTTHRDKLIKHLSKKGIMTMIHYPVPPHLQKVNAYLGLVKNQFPVAERISKTCLSLPIWPGLKSADVDRICEEIEVYWR